MVESSSVNEPLVWVAGTKMPELIKLVSTFNPKILQAVTVRFCTFHAVVGMQCTIHSS